MLSPAEFAGNLATAATTLAGLLLVFIGATTQDGTSAAKLLESGTTNFTNPSVIGT
jgi:hypothetical protein